MTSLKLNYFLRGSISKSSHPDVRASKYELGRGVDTPITVTGNFILELSSGWNAGMSTHKRELRSLSVDEITAERCRKNSTTPGNTNIEES